MAFYQTHFENRIYLQSTTLDSPALTHAFTTACGGNSHTHIKGLNLGFRVNDRPEDVMDNYRLVADDFGFSLDRTVLAKQTHTDHIRKVTEEDCGKGLTKLSDIEDTDGLMTNRKDIVLVVFSADCIPILLSDPVQGVIAAIHSGWRGSVKNISGKAVEKMKKEYHSDPKNIYAAIGPSIGACCFEIGEDIVTQFDSDFVRAQPNGKYLVNLKGMVAQRLQKSGIPAENIDISEECTVCQAGKYYSYRAQKDKTGRQAAFIYQRNAHRE